MTEIRRLTVDDYPAFRRLWSEAFQGGRQPVNLEPSEGWLDSVRLGAFCGAKLVACTSVHPMNLIWGERDAPCGGIADVACAMTERGRGHAGKLLVESLRVMHESGMHLSCLGPFSYSFYQKYGWDWVGEMRRITVPTEIVPVTPQVRNLETYEGLEALDIVKPLYLRYARQYRGMCDRIGRTPNWWDQRLGLDNDCTTYVYVYRDPEAGVATGYMTFRHPQGGDVAGVGDFVAFDPIAYRALLSSLHYANPKSAKATWEAPMDDTLPIHVIHWDLEQKVKPLFMGRIIDVVAALETNNPRQEFDGTSVVSIHDEYCPWNSGTFSVEAANGAVHVLAASAEPEVKLDIRALSQAYWGYPTLDRLRKAGRVEVNSERSYELLRRLLPPAVSFFQNWF